jgi:PBSX family phage terminase large subunit
MVKKTAKLTFDIANINRVYRPLLDNKDRYLVLYGGAGSGKSVFAVQKLILRMLQESGHRILVVRKVASTLRESVFALFASTISSWGLSKAFTVPKGSGDMTISCGNGSQIIFTGLDDPEKLKSIANITAIWVEEASELEQVDFEQLDLRLRGQSPYYKQIMISFNPISSMHWLKGFFFDRDMESRTICHTTYKDNKWIDEDYAKVLEGLKTTNPQGYKVYCLGEWGVYEGQFFSMWDREKHVVKPFDIPKSWTRVRAMDWGSYRPYAVTWYAIDYDGRAWLYRELYGYGGKANLGTKETAQQVARKIKEIEKAAEETTVYGVADPACWIKTGSSGPSIAEDFALEGVVFAKADNDRLQGWEQVKIRLVGIDDKPWLTVFSTCQHTIRTLPIMMHDKTKPEDMDSDLEDHLADSIRYFCTSRPWKPIHAEEKKKPRDYFKEVKEEVKSWLTA